MFEHDHPLDLIDLWSKKLQYEEEDEEDQEENEDLVSNPGFNGYCFRCEKSINWFHRYYYKCCQCRYSIHKYCAELPERVEDICEVDHTLYFYQKNFPWLCNICGEFHYPNKLCYRCSVCEHDFDADCVAQRLQMNIIHHPSHKHPLVPMPKKILCECDACGKEHKGIFIRCTICTILIHEDCALLPKKLQIQHTNSNFFHIHPLTLAYSFPRKDQLSLHFPRCRVCQKYFHNYKVGIYKCEKCRYYTHLDCATSRHEPFMSILAPPDKTTKNYEDVEHPNLIHLPFHDPSSSILMHCFKKDGSSAFEVPNTHISHQHPLILEDTQCTDITSPISSKVNTISFHDPMKKIELLCNACVRPITTTPIYVCADKNERCNFVLHEWCSRLPTKLNDHFDHPKHDLILHSETPGVFFGVFYCSICYLPCNGFAYCCEQCNYFIDVHCAFLPKEITHTHHPNHLLTREYGIKYGTKNCMMCEYRITRQRISFGCHDCDLHIHPVCAMLIPETTTHKCDTHPLKLSYIPIENHKIEYFCEICEDDLNPERPFYHCHECMQSVHTACAPSILRYETCMGTKDSDGIYRFINVKFGSIYSNAKVHRHPLSFVQGIADDGSCVKGDHPLQYEMIFKCFDCKFAICIHCCEAVTENYI